jgi:hypothetical protein
MTNLINGGVAVYTVRGENMIKLTAGGGAGAFAGSEIYMGYMGASGASTTQINGAAGEAVGANADASGKYSGLKVQYSTGPWVLMLDQQSSKNAKASATSNTFNRDATKVGLGFKYNPTSIVSFQTWNKERKDQTTPAAAFAATAGAAKDSGYGIQVHHDLGGGWMAHAQYAKANNIKGTTTGEQANTGATGMTLGATKAMSKRTHVYGSYHKITNQSAAAYGMAGGNYASGTAAAGADTKMIALGMIHNF